MAGLFEKRKPVKRKFCVALAAALLATVARPAAAPPAELRVEGLGWWRDHSMRGTLTLLLGDQLGRTLDASAIEDAALVLFSTLDQEGYLHPDIRVRVAEAKGGKDETFALDSNLEHPLPRPIAAVRVVYIIRKGPRYTVGRAAFVGLTAMRSDQARTYFRGKGVLPAERLYSPGGLRRSAANLLNELQRRGYAEAEVTAVAKKVDPKTHVADILVTVQQGPLWRARTLLITVVGPGPTPPDLEKPKYGRPWSVWWSHDAESDLRRWYFSRGYPDVRVSLAAHPNAPRNGVREVMVDARIDTGSEVHLGTIRFDGNTRTSDAVLRPLVRAKPGQALNPLQADDAEYRISRLGVFSNVDLHFEPSQGPVRDVVYDLREGKKQDVDLLLGWGSYEELRGGVEWRDYDLWGLAHEGTLRIVQSLKSSEGEYDYSIPELFGTSSDLTDKFFGFRRIERAFVDEQFGNTISVSTPLKGIGAQLTTGYTFERVRASSNTLATVLSETANANATSVQAIITRDKRDNPLVPRKGYKISFEIEEASRMLGGQVDFQEFQLAAAYHTPWGHSRWIHLGLSEQVVTTYGAKPGQELPPNIYLYPGGEDSIRGYSLGQAAPRNSLTGAYLPAQAALLVNVELEQALTSKLSAIIFSDTLGATATLAHYPVDYWLYSVGPGLTYQTPIGPVRLEYGRNLNPRHRDPLGTLQFSVGFPF
jgi:outer membrane protein assembly factor BamA